MELERKLMERELQGNLRTLKVTGKLVDFASNDYLGLARSEMISGSVVKEMSNHLGCLNGFGSTGSRLLTGNSQYALDLEDRVAAFHGYEAGLLFNCGYMANAGLLSAIAAEQDIIFFDTHVHASTHDGIRLSKARGISFRHNDIEHLRRRLKNIIATGKRFICVESIYSTDGSETPLNNICELAKQYGAHLIVDEAHALGICGPEGRGLVAQYGLMKDVFAQIITFGKALGVHGAMVLGSNTLKQVLVNFARTFIYTTALPLIFMTAINTSYNLFPLMENERLRVRRLIQRFQDSFPNASQTHIQTIKIKGNAAVNLEAEKLAYLGYDVRALTSPTVRRGSEILRICLHAFNTEQEVQVLLKHIQRLIHE